jgi:hypothetical protein
MLSLRTEIPYYSLLRFIATNCGHQAVALYRGLRVCECVSYRGADKSLAQPGGKQATATEGFDIHVSYLQS